MSEHVPGSADQIPAPVSAPEQEIVLPHAITDVTVALATKIMQAAKKNAREEIKRRRQAEEDDGEIVVALKKKLKTAMDEKKAVVGRSLTGCTQFIFVPHA